MKIKYTGEQDEITLRGVTFEKGKAVDLSDNQSLLNKALGLEYFKVAKARKVNASD